MNRTIKLVSIILSFVVIVICSIWFYTSRNLEAGAATLTALVAFIGFFFIKDKGDKSNIKMSQTAGENSKLYQSGRDIRIQK